VFCIHYLTVFSVISCICICRIREKKRIIILESREKRKVEKPRMPRTAKKMKTKTMESELGAMGVDVDSSENVGFQLIAFFWFFTGLFVLCRKYLRISGVVQFLICNNLHRCFSVVVLPLAFVS